MPKYIAMNRVVTKPIPVNEPVLSEESKKNVNDALETGWISSAGKYVSEFEAGFAEFLGVKYAVTVSNGTAALHLAILSLGIGKGDEVIVPAFTMAATWLAVIHTGAKPVFVDCEPDTYNIDPSLIESKITKKTKAIIPVHIYGHPAEMDSILKIARKHQLFVIEDAAEAHGAEYKGKKCGSLGDINCFSFYANKIITTGEGGMVVTNDEHLAKEARKLKDLYHSDQKRFIHEKIGYNYRLTNMQAALGCGELKHIDQYVAKKQHLAGLYSRLLKDIPGIRLPTTRPSVKNVFWMYSILIDERKLFLTRDDLKAKLKERNIDTRDFFYSPSDQPVLEPYLSIEDRFPVTDFISRRGLYLPSGLAITDQQIKAVVKNVKEIVGETLAETEIYHKTFTPAKPVQNPVKK